MITKYYDIDPLASEIGYGFSGFMDRRAEIDAEQKRIAAAKKAKRKKLLTLGLTAGAGAVALPLVAPALGLAGTAATGFSSGIGGTAATAGAFGAGGVLSGAGTLAAGLTGASIGAQAGGAFAEGDIAGGFGAIARPIAGALQNQENRRVRLADRATERAANLSDSFTRDRFQTDENIRQQVEQSTIEEFGMTRTQATQAARAEYEALVSGGSQAGGELDLSSPVESFQSAGAYGPFQDEMPGAMGPPAPSRKRNVPGPSPFPGMEENWTIKQLQARTKLINDYNEKVEGPDRIQDPEARNAYAHSVARALDRIQVTTMPAKEQTMTFGPNGTMVPAQRGLNAMPPGAPIAGAVWFDDKGTPHHFQPPKDSPQKEPLVYTDSTTGTSTKLEGDFGTLPDGSGRMWHRQGINIESSSKDGGDGGKGKAKRTQAIAAAQKQFTAKNDQDDTLTLPKNELVYEAVDQQELIGQVYELKESAKEAKAMLRDLGRSDQESLQVFYDWVREAEEAFGPDRKQWPKPVFDQSEDLKKDFWHVLQSANPE